MEARITQVTPAAVPDVLVLPILTAAVLYDKLIDLACADKRGDALAGKLLADVLREVVKPEHEVLQNMMIGLLGHQRPEVRQNAALCLGVFGAQTTPQNVAKLSDKIATETDPNVLGAIASALGAIPGEKSVRGLMHFFKKPELGGVAQHLCTALTEHGAAAACAIPQLEKMLMHEDSFWKASAALNKIRAVVRTQNTETLQSLAGAGSVICAPTSSERTGPALSSELTQHYEQYAAQLPNLPARGEKIDCHITYDAGYGVEKCRLRIFAGQNGNYAIVLSADDNSLVNLARNYELVATMVKYIYALEVPMCRWFEVVQKEYGVEAVDKAQRVTLTFDSDQQVYTGITWSPPLGDLMQEIKKVIDG